MAWCLKGGNILLEAIMTKFNDANMPHQVKNNEQREVIRDLLTKFQVYV